MPTHPSNPIDSSGGDGDDEGNGNQSPIQSSSRDEREAFQIAAEAALGSGDSSASETAFGGIEARNLESWARSHGQIIEAARFEDLLLISNRTSEQGLITPDSNAVPDSKLQKVDQMTSGFLVQDKNTINGLSNDIATVELAKIFVKHLRNNELLSGRGRKSKFLVHTAYSDFDLDKFLGRINAGRASLNIELKNAGLDEFRKFVPGDIISDF